MASECADSRGASSRSISRSRGVDRDDARLPNTSPARDSSRPERSSATTVFSKVGGSSEPTIAPTSARWWAMPASSASRQCSRVMAANGGSSNGRDDGEARGVSAGRAGTAGGGGGGGGGGAGGLWGGGRDGGGGGPGALTGAHPAPPPVTCWSGPPAGSRPEPARGGGQEGPSSAGRALVEPHRQRHEDAEQHH